MSKREKNLLSLLILVALVVGLLLGYKNFYQPRYEKAQRELIDAKQKGDVASAILKDSDTILSERQWLEKHTPDPRTPQKAQSELQSECERRAKNVNLTVKKQTPLPTEEPEGAFYHRARMDFLVSGKESSFYRWMVSVDSPENFRRVTYLRLNPLRDDDTQIEARVTIEQWFVPQTLLEE